MKPHFFQNVQLAKQPSHTSDSLLLGLNFLSFASSGKFCSACFTVFHFLLAEKQNRKLFFSGPTFASAAFWCSGKQKQKKTPFFDASEQIGVKMIYWVLGWRWRSLYFIIRTIIQHKDCQCRQWGFRIFLIVIFIPFLSLGRGRLQSVLPAVRQAVRETPTVRQPHQLLRPPPQAGKPHTPQWGADSALMRSPEVHFILLQAPQTLPDWGLGFCYFPAPSWALSPVPVVDTDRANTQRYLSRPAHFHCLILWHVNNQQAIQRVAFLKKYFFTFGLSG